MIATQTSEQLKRTGSNPEGLHAIATDTSQGLFVVAENGEVSFCNARLEELLDIKPSQVVGHPSTVLFHAIAAASDDTARVEAELKAAASDLDALHEHPGIEVTLTTQPPRRVQIQFFPVHAVVDGRLTRLGWGGIVQDTTARWQEIEQWNEQLAVLIRGFRSLVATVKGFVTTLLSGHRYWEEGERQRFLENIDEHVDQLSRLLENAQEMFKLEAGVVELERRPTDLKRLLQRITQSLSYQKSGHQFTLDIPDDLPAIEIDSLRVEQAIQNILDYAARYSPREKKIRIAARLDDDQVQLSIVDRGMGLAEADLSRIFDGSLQLAQGNAEAARGAEIGLYVARGLVLAHGGHIWVESTSETSTTIAFTLPVEARSAHQGTGVPQRKITELTPQPTNGLEMRPSREIAKILVVDDDAQMLRLLKIKLEAEGFEVITATRGNNALDLAVVEQPDVILLDVSLPDANGFDVCIRLREFTSVPIIMITGQSKEEDMVRGLDAGADDYLVKPVRNKELLARVRANIRRARVPELAPSKPTFRMGDLMIDFAQRQVTVRSKTIRLTPTEYKLLYHLAVNAGRILTHSQLLSKVWGPGYEEDTQYLWVNISRLRGKLEHDPSSPEYIMTEPGVGYYLPDDDRSR